jgi:hypothetical protein
MGQQRLKWGQIERYLKHHGYEIRSQGGDKIIVAPPGNGGQRTRNTLRIGHTSCRSAGTEVLKVYVSKLRNVFGISFDDILNE